MIVSSSECILCGAAGPSLLFESGGRLFYECSICDLLFVDPAQTVSLEEEKKRYDAHQNDTNDSGYLNFLSTLRDALLPHLQSHMKGLDFGAGPSQAMAQLFLAHGFSIDRYDPFYAPAHPPLGAYDFITCSEVVEHFKEPAREFEYLKTLLAPGGVLGIMTSFRDPYRGEPSWWYLRDKTHHAFYSKKTFAWIGARYHLALKSLSENVAILRKDERVTGQ